MRHGSITALNIANRYIELCNKWNRYVGEFNAVLRPRIFRLPSATDA
jgi:hypothetical protein